ncbi:TPA: N-acetylmuramidase, partial [Streptococcus equi subsp. zooepidemicus]|nr:N-acetylmuramidase [Streptococcus equi subsp. zooepidemicus]
SSLASVWNPYRKSYTDTETLAVDKAWAQRMGY